jgi:hypothetical protein
MINQDVVRKRGISRLCHFTKTANLPFILGDGVDDYNGIVSNKVIKETRFLEINDINRYDKRPELICTSIQYPNLFFFEKSQENSSEHLLSNWVVLLISPDVINNETYFCPVNAAKKRGQFISKGVEVFCDIFAKDISKYESKTPLRNKNYMLNIPTDIQAEVLFEHQISRDSIFGLVFKNKRQAEIEKLRLKLCNVELNNIEFYYSEYFFEKDSVNFLKSGKEIPLYKLEE